MFTSLVSATTSRSMASIFGFRNIPRIRSEEPEASTHDKPVPVVEEAAPVEAAVPTVVDVTDVVAKSEKTRQDIMSEVDGLIKTATAMAEEVVQAGEKLVEPVAMVEEEPLVVHPDVDQTGWDISVREDPSQVNTAMAIAMVEGRRNDKRNDKRNSRRSHRE